MMNLLQLEDELKAMPDRALQESMVNPQGSVPQFLVLSEIKRRSDMRKAFSVNQAPGSTVAEDLMSGNSQPAGLGSLAMQPPAGAPPTEAVPQATPRGMADGGLVRGFREGGYVYTQNDPIYRTYLPGMGNASQSPGIPDLPTSLNGVHPSAIAQVLQPQVRDGILYTPSVLGDQVVWVPSPTVPNRFAVGGEREAIAQSNYGPAPGNFASDQERPDLKPRFDLFGSGSDPLAYSLETGQGPGYEWPLPAPQSPPYTGSPGERQAGIEPNPLDTITPSAVSWLDQLENERNRLYAEEANARAEQEKRGIKTPEESGWLNDALAALGYNVNESTIRPPATAEAGKTSSGFWDSVTNQAQGIVDAASGVGSEQDEDQSGVIVASSPDATGATSGAPTSGAGTGAGMGDDFMSVLEQVQQMSGTNPYASIEEAIKKSQDEALSEREKDRWMALAQAGLAMAAGESPYFASNVGKGGLVGLAALSEDKREYNKQRQADLELQQTLIQAREASRQNDQALAAKLYEIAADMDYKNRYLAASQRGGGGASQKDVISLAKTFLGDTSLIPQEEMQARWAEALKTAMAFYSGGVSETSVDELSALAGEGE